MASDFGALLQRLRTGAGLTQEQLAQRAEISTKTVGRLENRPKQNCQQDTLMRLANALGLAGEARLEFLAAADNADTAPAQLPGQRKPAEPAISAGPPLPSPRPNAPRHPKLEAVAVELAAVLAGRWQRELEQRGADYPFPLPVRWRPVADGLADHWANVASLPAGSDAEPLDLEGNLGTIAEVYRRIPSGRLVVLGEAGSGKSILTLRFLLDCLRTRSDADPVPVLFSIGSWDPAASALRDWLVDRLQRDHPELNAPAPGGTDFATALVSTGRILPVLDGFDEIPERARRAALQTLNGTSLPLLLTSRPEEYAAAAAQTAVLASAAGIHLVGLTPADLSDYLRRAHRTGRWDVVLAAWAERPDDPACRNLAAVLSTPLMVMLARTACDDAGQDPEEFLDLERFPTAAALENHLLDSFVPAVYQSPASARPRRDWTSERVQRWLRHLARHVDGQDLAWWRLGDALGQPRRIVGVVLACALVTAVCDWLVFGVALLFGYGTPIGVLIDGFVLGPTAGLGFGLVYGVMVVHRNRRFEPARIRLRLLGRSYPAVSATTAAQRFAAGLAGRFVAGLGYVLLATTVVNLVAGTDLPFGTMARVALVDIVFFGLTIGLAAGLVFSAAALLEAPVELESATAQLLLPCGDRATAIRRILVLAPTFAVTIAFSGRLVGAVISPVFGQINWELSYGFVAGTLAGIAGSVCYTLSFTAWGQWVLFAKIWLPLSGRLPWAVTEFLGDAYARGVLRQIGATYQFRHARLQERLSSTPAAASRP
ncbi:NACHT domain-containing protein [Amycolatopsis benzoatilytica]|uniref:NACHT domain-containing protein n=1 Tax=Amycolatopsis benzoatilytica TaxID=346045 RepID=UPI00036065F3|nr:helix-turn-helix transcriptional regulator [Amycolatopsis benzoatilytica]